MICGRPFLLEMDHCGLSHLQCALELLLVVMVKVMEAARACGVDGEEVSRASLVAVRVVVEA
jgi:hypothetical protein